MAEVFGKLAVNIPVDHRSGLVRANREQGIRICRRKQGGGDQGEQSSLTD
jgi:hypothetical protein